MAPSRTPRPHAADRAAFARRLQAAMDKQGYTYEETARRAREYLPPEARLSAVSVWQYVNGKTFPRRLSYIEALSRVLEIDFEELYSRTEEDSEKELPEGSLHAHAPQGGVQVYDLDGGSARLSIDIRVPWPLAIKILALLRVSGENEEEPFEE